MTEHEALILRALADLRTEVAAMRDETRAAFRDGSHLPRGANAAAVKTHPRTESQLLTPPTRAGLEARLSELIQVEDAAFMQRSKRLAGFVFRATEAEGMQDRLQAISGLAGPRGSAEETLAKLEARARSLAQTEPDVTSAAAHLMEFSASLGVQLSVRDALEYVEDELPDGPPVRRESKAETIYTIERAATEEFDAILARMEADALRLRNESSGRTAAEALEHHVAALDGVRATIKFRSSAAGTNWAPAWPFPSAGKLTPRKPEPEVDHATEMEAARLEGLHNLAASLVDRNVGDADALASLGRARDAMQVALSDETLMSFFRAAQEKK